MTNRHRYIAKPPSEKFIVSQDDIVFADLFTDLATVLDGIPNSEAVTLLLSTCRNHFITINALFWDLRLVIGHGDMPSLLARCCYGLLHPATPSKVVGVERKDLEHALRALAAFEEKSEVWTRRVELLSQFETGLSLLGRQHHVDRMRLMLDQVRTPTDRLGKTYSKSFFEINLEERPHLARIHDSLVSIYAGARAVAGVIDRLLDVEQGNRQLGLNGILFLQPDREDDPYEELRATLVRLAHDLQCEVLDGGGAIRSRLIPEVTLHFPIVDSQLHSENGQLVKLLRAAERNLHERLSDPEVFRPNVGTPPMPPMFILDLIARNPMDELIHEHSFTEAEYVNAERTQTLPTQVVIGILSCPIHPKLFSEPSFRFGAASRKVVGSYISALLVEAARVARDKGIHMLIAPEYFLPDDILGEVVSVMKREGIVFIGGQEMRELGAGRMSARALIVIPDADGTWTQSKQYPSPDEPLYEGRWSRDHKLKIFQGTGIGTFAVVVCHDLMEMEVISALISARTDIDFLVVPCYNKHGELFQTIGKSMAVQLYCYVAIANTVPGESTTVESPEDESGSAIIGPFNTMAAMKMSLSREELSVGLSRPDGVGEAAILWQQVSLAEIRSRELGKPKRGLITPPRSRIARRSRD